MKQIYFFLVALMVTTLSFGQITNAGFESWTGGTLDSWTLDSGITVTEEATTFAEGAKSAHVQVTTQSQGSTDFRQDVNVVAGKTYDFSVQVYQLDNKSRARLYIDGYQGYSDETLVNQWQTLSYSYTAAATGTISIGLRFYDISANWAGGPSDMYVDDFQMIEQVAPSIAITAPANGATLLSGDVTVSVSVQNFVVGNPGAGIDGHIHWTLDDGSGAVNQPMKYDTADEMFAGLTDGTYTVEMTLVDNSNNAIAPLTKSSVTFNVVTPAQVTDIAALRAGTVNNYYELTGEALLTFQQNHRNQKFIEDASAGILIDDNAGKITTTYAIGDGITGIKGKLTAYQGMLQFQPTEDSGAASSTGNTLTPQTVTLADLTATPENYESELVKVVGVTMDNATANFANNSVHALTLGADAFDFKSRFFDADYVTSAMAVPTAATDVTGIVTENSTGMYWLTARSSNDISQLLSVADNTIEGFNVYPNPARNVITVSTKLNQSKKVEIFNILGKRVLNTTTENTVNITSLQTGVYIVKVTENKVSATRKLIIK